MIQQILSGAGLFALAALSPVPAHAQADTGPVFVTFERQGATRSVFEAQCGGSEYQVEQVGEGWTFSKDGEQVSEEIDAFLSRALGYFDYSVQLDDLDCGDFGGPGVTEGLNFRVVKRFDVAGGPVLQIGGYQVLIGGARIQGHNFHNLTRRDEPPARGVSRIHAFLDGLGLEDAPGMIDRERVGISVSAEDRAAAGRAETARIGGLSCRFQTTSHAVQPSAVDPEGQWIQETKAGYHYVDIAPRQVRPLAAFEDDAVRDGLWFHTRSTFLPHGEAEYAGQDAFYAFDAAGRLERLVLVHHHQDGGLHASLFAANPEIVTSLEIPFSSGLVRTGFGHCEAVAEN